MATNGALELPEKLVEVFSGEALFRGAYGGRGSAKSRSFAKMAAVYGLRCAQAKQSGVIVCGREFQNSLDESSMAEVKQAIESEPWLAKNYEIGEKYIRTKDGRIDFAFVGLRRNIESVKSTARIRLFGSMRPSLFPKPLGKRLYLQSGKRVRRSGLPGTRKEEHPRPIRDLELTHPIIPRS